MHTGKFLSPSFVKGVGFEKGRGSLFPFLSFGSFSTWKRNVLLFFPWERNILSFLLERSRFFPASRIKGNEWYFLHKVHQKYALGSPCDPWGKAGSPALLWRLFSADCHSAPGCTTSVLLQILQGLALPTRFTRKFAQTFLPPGHFTPRLARGALRNAREHGFPEWGETHATCLGISSNKEGLSPSFSHDKFNFFFKK